MAVRVQVGLEGGVAFKPFINLQKDAHEKRRRLEASILPQT